MKYRYIISALSLSLLIALPHAAQASKTHVARKSESLHSIARKYHVSINELKAVNNITGSHIEKGDRIIIPSSTPSLQGKQIIVPELQSYAVAKGDSLPKIAKKTGIKMSDLRRFNSIKGNMVKPGQILLLAEASRPNVEPPHMVQPVNRLQLVNRELLNEQEFSDTLAELTDVDMDRPVDLAKKLGQNNQDISRIKKSAYGFLGARYLFGGNSRSALDCSSFTQQVFRELDVKLPRTAREQFHVGNEVARGDLQKGDLVFFQTYAQFPSHVGIYLGDRKMIHASSRDRRVVISSMDTPYYLSRYLGAKRVGKVTTEHIDFNDLLLGVEVEKDGDVLSNDTLGLSLSLNN